MDCYLRFRGGDPGEHDRSGALDHDRRELRLRRAARGDQHARGQRHARRHERIRSRQSRLIPARVAGQGTERTGHRDPRALGFERGSVHAVLAEPRSGGRFVRRHHPCATREASERRADLARRAGLCEALSAHGDLQAPSVDGQCEAGRHRSSVCRCPLHRGPGAARAGVRRSLCASAAARLACDGRRLCRHATRALERCDRAARCGPRARARDARKACARHDARASHAERRWQREIGGSRVSLGDAELLHCVRVQWRAAGGQRHGVLPPGSRCAE